MYKISIRIVTIIVALLCTTSITFGQEIKRSVLGPPQTGAPFLTITPDSRGGAMGDAGAATSPDIYSMYWNPAKYAFLDMDMGASISYTPWLRKLVSDINLINLNFFKRIDKMQTVSATLRYFSLGDITFTDEQGGTTATGKPNEFAIDVAYARKLSDNFSGSVAFRYIRSDIANGTRTSDAVAANGFAADLSFFYLNEVEWGGRDGDFSAGINISNIGQKLSYDNGINKDFLPANLKLGSAYYTEIDNYNKIGFTLDINRIMVVKPTVDDDKKDLSVPASFFQSFGDFDIKDLTYSIGGEYIYADQFALRAGYYHEDETLGNGKFATAGAGIKFNMLTLDASYIITMASTNPLANTLRFSLSLNIDEMTGR